MDFFGIIGKKILNKHGETEKTRINKKEEKERLTKFCKDTKEFYINVTKEYNDIERIYKMMGNHILEYRQKELLQRKSKIATTQMLLEFNESLVLGELREILRIIMGNRKEKGNSKLYLSLSRDERTKTIINNSHSNGIFKEWICEGIEKVSGGYGSVWDWTMKQSCRLLKKCILKLDSYKELALALRRIIRNNLVEEEIYDAKELELMEIIKPFLENIHNGKMKPDAIVWVGEKIINDSNKILKNTHINENTEIKEKYETLKKEIQKASEILTKERVIKSLQNCGIEKKKNIRTISQIEEEVKKTFKKMLEIIKSENDYLIVMQKCPEKETNKEKIDYIQQKIEMHNETIDEMGKAIKELRNNTNEEKEQEKIKQCAELLEGIEENAKIEINTIIEQK